MKLCPSIVAIVIALFAASPAHATTFLTASTGRNARTSVPIAAGESREARSPAAMSAAAANGSVPELTTWALMSLGFGLAGGVVRVRQTRSPGQL